MKNGNEPNTLILPDLIRRTLLKPSGVPVDGVTPPVYGDWLDAANRAHLRDGTPEGTTAEWRNKMAYALILARIESSPPFSSILRTGD